MVIKRNQENYYVLFVWLPSTTKIGLHQSTFLQNIPWLNFFFLLFTQSKFTESYITSYANRVESITLTRFEMKKQQKHIFQLDVFYEVCE